MSIVALTVCTLVPVSALLSSKTVLRSSGTIKQTIPVFFDYAQSVGRNRLVLGSQVHYWHELHRNSPLRQQIADANLRVIRVFIFDYAATGGYSWYNPCASWNEATTSGTWDWSLFDSYMTAIYETGAVPLICLNIGDNRVPTGMETDSDTGLPSPESFAAYATSVAQHMKTNGWNNAIWEVFNEIHKKWNFWPLDSIYTAENRAKWDKIVTVYNSVSEAISNVFPDAKIGETSTQYKGWCEWLAEKGVRNDFIGHHKYDSGNAPEEQASDQELFSLAVNGQGVHSGHPEIRWLPEQALSIFAQHGKHPDFYITETGLNHDWDPQDVRKFTPLGAAWYATELVDFAERGISLSIFYDMASNMGSDYPKGFGLVEVWGQHATRYPYYTTMLFGTHLLPGDELLRCSTISSSISCLAWHRGSEYRVALIHKEPDNVVVSLNFEGLSATVQIDSLEYSGDPYIGALTSRSLGICENKAIVEMKGYSVVLVSLSPTS